MENPSRNVLMIPLPPPVSEHLPPTLEIATPEVDIAPPPIENTPSLDSTTNNIIPPSSTVFRIARPGNVVPYEAKGEVGTGSKPPIIKHGALVGINLAEKVEPADTYP